jgi:hypothetical protein
MIRNIIKFGLRYLMPFYTNGVSKWKVEKMKILKDTRRIKAKGFALETLMLKKVKQIKTVS